MCASSHSDREGSDVVCESDRDVMMRILFCKIIRFSDLCLYFKPHNKVCSLSQKLLVVTVTLVSEYDDSNGLHSSCAS